MAILDEDARGEERQEESRLLSEVEAAIRDLKAKKSSGKDNISAELLQHGDTETAKIVHKLCNEILEKHMCNAQWNESILIAIPKKSNSRKCSDYRTISLISHAAKVMLKILQKRVPPRIEEILSESQVGFRPGRSTTEQITNVRLLIEKAKNTGRILYQNFIDFRKAFDRVWHEALWHSMEKANIGTGMTELLRKLYKQARSKVLVGDQ